MTTLSIQVNRFDDWGQVVGTKTVEMTREQIADVVGHAAQLIAIHRAARRSSGDMDGIIAELDDAMYATDVMENIEVHAEPKTDKPKSAPMGFREPSKESVHRKFWEHIKAGGRVWRDDPLNNVQEWLDLERLGGDANEIQRYGYNNLTIQMEPTAS